MTINLAAIEMRNEKLTADIADVAEVLTMVLNSEPLNETTRGSLVGSVNVLSGIVANDTAPEDIAALLAEVRRLEGELKEEQDRSSDIGCYAASLRTEMRRVSERMNEILGE